MRARVSFNYDFKKKEECFGVVCQAEKGRKYFIIMEMPVPCDNCGEWIELNDCKESNLTKKLMCRSCCQVEDEVHQLKEEIIDIQLDLDNEVEYMKGQRREYKKEIKEKKERIKELGFNYDDLVYY